MSAEIPDGAVLIARAILNSSLWAMRPEDCKVAVTCIALCNWKDHPWFDGNNTIVIKRGQFVRSREELAEACILSIQQTRTSVQHLEKVGFLTRKSTSQYTIYTLPKYDHYQSLAKYSDSANPEVNQRLTSDQPAPNHKQERQERKEGEQGGFPPYPPQVFEASGSEDEVVRQLTVHAVNVCRCPNAGSTVERYVRGWVIRHGGAEVQRILSLPEARGQTVVSIEDRWFNAVKTTEQKETDIEWARRMWREGPKSKLETQTKTSEDGPPTNGSGPSSHLSEKTLETDTKPGKAVLGQNRGRDVPKSQVDELRRKIDETFGSGVMT